MHRTFSWRADNQIVHWLMLFGQSRMLAFCCQAQYSRHEGCWQPLIKISPLMHGFAGKAY